MSVRLWAAGYTVKCQNYQFTKKATDVNNCGNYRCSRDVGSVPVEMLRQIEKKTNLLGFIAVIRKIHSKIIHNIPSRTLCDFSSRVFKGYIL